MRLFHRTTLIAIVFVDVTISHGQSTVAAAASATIVNPITIAKTADLNFGNVRVESSTGGTVTIVPFDSRLKYGGASLASSNTQTQATFVVTGAEMYAYELSLPSMVTLTRSNGTETMRADGFTSKRSIVRALNTDIQVLSIGATLNVAAAQAPGVYISSKFDVIINYD